MRDVDLSAINLNLLVALDALLREAHVTRAAKRAGVSQSAMSHQLAALRELFGDALLVRGAEGMELTPRALQLREPLHAALGRIQEVLRDPADFVPATASGRFVIGSSDSLGAFILPSLLGRLSRLAPGVEVAFVESTPRDFHRLLGANEVQLTIGAMVREAGLEETLLFEDSFVCALRAGHPALERPFDLAHFVELEHVLVIPTGAGAGFVDEALSEHGLTRRVALRTTSSLVAPVVVAQTDLVLTAPRHSLLDAAPRLGLTLLRPPVELPQLRIAMSWHDRFSVDAAHAWLRSQIAAVTAGLLPPLSEAGP